MIGDLKAALESIKIISDLLKTNKSITNHKEIDDAIGEVTDKLISARGIISSCQEKQEILTKRIVDLEKNLAEYKNFERQSSRYVLHKFKSGMLAYALKPGMENGEQAHYLCNHCMEKGKHHKLYILNGKHASCKECGIGGFV